MNKDIQAYHDNLSPEDIVICDKLHEIISANLPNAQSKVWHGHPVWFLEENPIVGYHRLKDNVRLLFWSGQSFNEPGLSNEGSFKAAEVRYEHADQINVEDLKRYLEKSIKIQWDYKNIVKHRGVLNPKLGV